MKTNVLLIMLILFSVIGSGQNSGLLKDVLFDNNSNQTLKVYENKSGSYIIAEGPYRGYPSVDYFTSVVFQNGSYKQLRKNEFIIAASKGNLLTEEFDAIAFKTKYYCYQISSNSLNPLNQIEFKGEHKMDVLENGSIIISDQWELYGTIFGIYNNHLKLLNQFKPFESGYKSVFVTATENKVIAIVCKEESKPETKYFEIDASNGSIISQKKLEINLNPVKVLSFGNKTFVVENTKIIALFEGVIMWEKNIVLPNYDIVINASQNAIFYCTASKLVKLSADNGEELFSKYLSDIYGNATDTLNLMIRPILFETNKNNGTTYILLSETNRGTLLSTIPKLNPKLYSIDASRNIKENKKIKLTTLNWVDIIETKEHKTKLITNKQQIEIK